MSKCWHVALNIKMVCYINLQAEVRRREFEVQEAIIDVE